MAVVNVTLNPNDMNGTNVLSNGNLTVVMTTATSGNIRATHGKSSGKWYWEVKLDGGNAYSLIGVANKALPITSAVLTGTTGDALNFRFYRGDTGSKYPENVSYGTAWATGSVIGVALDLDNGTLGFYKDGVGMGFSHINLLGMGEVFPFLKSGSTTTKTITVNFGAKPFVYPVPDGYLAYNLEFSNKILIISGDGQTYSPKLAPLYNKLISTALTSNTSSNDGTAFASSINSTSYDAWKAFDNSYSDSPSAWITANNTIQGYLGFTFNTPKVMGYYTIFPRHNSLPPAPKSWTFEGSNDGFVTFDILDSQVGVTNWVTSTGKDYLIDNKKAYTSYRINISQNNGDSSYSSIGELKMYERIPQLIKLLPTNDENTFLQYGMDKGETINLDYLLDGRTIVNNVHNTLGSGKVFKQAIDTSKIPIKKVSIE